MSEKKEKRGREEPTKVAAMQSLVIFCAKKTTFDCMLSRFTPLFDNKFYLIFNTC